MNLAGQAPARRRSTVSSTVSRALGPAAPAGQPERSDPARIDPVPTDAERIDAERIDAERIDAERIDSAFAMTLGCITAAA